MEPETTAIVVNWNTADLLDACLASIAAHGGSSVEAIVVDNGSTDGSAELVRERWPSVELIANDDNEGYTRANNQALARATGTYLLLINADAMLQPGCLPAMIARLEDHPDAGVVGPRLVYGDGSFQRWTAGAAPSLGAAVRYFWLLDRLRPSPLPPRSVYLPIDTDEAFTPDWVSSACMLVRRSALEEVGGGLDERYFCYMDDVDLCERLRGAGWTVWYDPSAVATHLMGQATKRQTGAASPAALRNFNDYFARRHGTSAATALRAVEVLGFLLRAGLCAVAAALGRSGRREQGRSHLRNARVSLQRGPA